MAFPIPLEQLAGTYSAIDLVLSLFRSACPRGGSLPVVLLCKA